MKIWAAIFIVAFGLWLADRLTRTRFVELRLLNSRFATRFAGVAMRVFVFCWGLVLGIVGIAGLWAAIRCLRSNASLLADAFFPLVQVVICTAIGLWVLYGAYRCLMVVFFESWDD